MSSHHPKHTHARVLRDSSQSRRRTQKTKRRRRELCCFCDETADSIQWSLFFVVYSEREREEEREMRTATPSGATTTGRVFQHHQRRFSRPRWSRGDGTRQQQQQQQRGGARAMAAGKPGMDGTPYVAKNTFVIPSDEAGVKAADIVSRFLSEMDGRERKMKTMPDYTSSSLREVGTNTYEFTQEWKTKVGYESWMNTPERRRSHFPVGVYQYLPKDKWSVPENFAPVIKQKDPPKPKKK